MRRKTKTDRKAEKERDRQTEREKESIQSSATVHM